MSSRRGSLRRRSAGADVALPLPRERKLSLADALGVYRFLCERDVLYTGKAMSLRKRAGSHFTSGRLGERALEMLTHERNIAVTITARALEAALPERDEIKQIEPATTCSYETVNAARGHRRAPRSFGRRARPHASRMATRVA